MYWKAKDVHCLRFGWGGNPPFIPGRLLLLEFQGFLQELGRYAGGNLLQVGTSFTEEDLIDYDRPLRDVLEILTEKNVLVFRKPPRRGAESRLAVLTQAAFLRWLKQIVEEEVLDRVQMVEFLDTHTVLKCYEASPDGDECVVFQKPNLSVRTARDIFQDKRVVAIVLTEKGRSRDPVQGLVTRLDLS